MINTLISKIENDGSLTAQQKEVKKHAVILCWESIRGDVLNTRKKLSQETDELNIFMLKMEYLGYFERLRCAYLGLDRKVEALDNRFTVEQKMDRTRKFYSRLMKETILRLKNK